jgi:hypothetical protein
MRRGLNSLISLISHFYLETYHAYIAYFALSFGTSIGFGELKRPAHLTLLPVDAAVLPS